MSAVYSNLKFVRFPDRLEALRSGAVAAPVHVRIKPTNRCNHVCWYCAYRAKNLQLGADMREADQIPAEKMFEIVDDLIAMGVEAATFSGGGEPLLYKPLPEVVERLARGGIKVAALSNGSNLKGRMADAFARYGTWLRLSVDAWDDASYAASRGAKAGGFARLLDNIRRFTASTSRCALGISFIVTQDNHAHLAEACAQFKAAGVRHVKLSGVVTGNDGGENRAYHGEFEEEVAGQIARARRLEDETFTIVDHYHALAERFDKPYRFCGYLQFLTVIGADRRVYTCQDKAYTGEGLLGSIERQSFREFWFSEANRARMNAIDPSKSCRHHCVSHGKNLAIAEYLSLDREHGCFV